MFKRLIQRIKAWFKEQCKSDKRLLDDWADDVLGDLDEPRGEMKN